MAVFYVLPPRPALGECLANMLQPFVPGASINRQACTDFIDSLIAGSPDGRESYVVYREELPEGEEVNAALREGFGAEDGDRVVDVSLGLNPGEPRVKSWRVGDMPRSHRGIEVQDGRSASSWQSVAAG
jgi:hypothetical protein